MALLLAKNGIIPPKEWNHDATIHNNDNYTVAMYLFENKINPPKEWLYDLDIKFDD